MQDMRLLVLILLNVFSAPIFINGSKVSTIKEFSTILEKKRDYQDHEMHQKDISSYFPVLQGTYKQCKNIEKVASFNTQDCLFLVAENNCSEKFITHFDISSSLSALENFLNSSEDVVITYLLGGNPYVNKGKNREINLTHLFNTLKKSKNSKTIIAKSHLHSLTSIHFTSFLIDLKEDKILALNKNTLTRPDDLAKIYGPIVYFDRDVEEVLGIQKSSTLPLITLKKWENLDKFTDLISLRKKQLSLYDEFSEKSSFVELGKKSEKEVFLQKHLQILSPFIEVYNSFPTLLERLRFLTNTLTKE